MCLNFHLQGCDFFIVNILCRCQPTWGVLVPSEFENSIILKFLKSGFLDFKHNFLFPSIRIVFARMMQEIMGRCMVKLRLKNISNAIGAFGFIFHLSSLYQYLRTQLGWKLHSHSMSGLGGSDPEIFYISLKKWWFSVILRLHVCPPRLSSKANMTLTQFLNS